MAMSPPRRGTSTVPPCFGRAMCASLKAAPCCSAATGKSTCVKTGCGNGARLPRCSTSCRCWGTTGRRWGGARGIGDGWARSETLPSPQTRCSFSMHRRPRYWSFGPKQSRSAVDAPWNSSNERTEQFPCAGRVDAGTFKVSDSVLLISNVFCGFFSLAGGRHQAIHKR